MYPKSHHDSGYTLVEITIVVTIVVIISLLVLIGIGPMAQIFKGYDARRKADLASLKIAFEDYYNDHECYPPASILNNCGSAELQPYLNAIPCNPDGNKPYTLFLVPEGSACPQKYAIYAPLIAFFDKLADSIPGCPNTFAAYSSDLLNLELIQGCTGKKGCANKYGCNEMGSCVIVAVDSNSPCSPWSCDSDCGLDCKISRNFCAPL